jgi:hypothetical protein
MSNDEAAMWELLMEMEDTQKQMQSELTALRREVRDLRTTRPRRRVYSSARNRARRTIQAMAMRRGMDPSDLWYDAYGLYAQKFGYDPLCVARTEGGRGIHGDKINGLDIIERDGRMEDFCQLVRGGLN